MKPASLAYAAIEPFVVLVSGILLWLGLVSLDRLAAGLAHIAAPGSAFLALAAPVCMEELGKLALALAFMLAGRRLEALRALFARPTVDGEKRWPGLALAAVVVFATAENLSYFVAFPGADMLIRLSWSLPVHLVGAMALILALERGRARTMVLAILLALGWHLTANAIASTGPALAVLAAGSSASLLLIAALSRVWLKQLIIEGTVHGKSRRT